MAKKGSKQTTTSGKLAHIQARISTRVCKHGSLGCRICNGETLNYHDKRKGQ